MSGVTRYEFEFDDRYLCDCGNGSRIIPVAIDTGEYVLASDYDRDTQALNDELDNIKRSWGLLHSERDELRAHVEAMQAENESARRTGAFWKDEKVCADTVIDQLRAQVEALRKEAEAMQDLLRKVAPHFAAPPGLGYLYHWIDAALQAKP